MLRRLAYVDASAFVKLLAVEAESAALADALEEWPLASSALLEVEAVLAVRRRDPSQADAVRAAVGAVRLFEIDGDIRKAAGAVGDPGLRALDAVHLATALSLGERCGAFFAYDERLIAAARAHGLTVTVPRP